MPRPSDDTILDDAIDELMSLRNKKHARDVIWKAYYDKKAKCARKCGKALKILILNAPCHGFGDLIFAMKLGQYLKDWYGAKVTIASPLMDGLVKLGWKKSDAVLLSSGGKSKANQCRRFKLLKLGRKVPQNDLVFIAPVQAGFDPNLRDVQHLIPYANTMNVFTFSEYNDDSKKGFDFDTGVGGKRMGLLLTNTNSIRGKPKKIKAPYALAYIASPESIANSEGCLISFLELIAKKYRKNKRMEVIVPVWVVKEIKYMAKRIKKRISPYYGNIAFKDAKGQLHIMAEDDSKRVFLLRGDILPVPNKEMIKLMKGSVKDILLTGDQSITDGLSCCKSKNIFYQIADWKMGFARELAKLMPNQYLKYKRTSCGTLKAVAYKSNYNKFVKEWDFRKLAKPKLDAIVLAALAIKRNEDIEELAEMITDSRTLRSMKKKVEEYFWEDSESEWE
jgi:hypothetical protein